MSNEELGAQLAAQLLGSDRRVAFEAAAEADSPAADAGDNPLESDFFRAINAFRAARAKGDAQEMAEAEEHLRSVVRGELTGE